jgi:hypothetical protein
MALDEYSILWCLRFAASHLLKMGSDARYHKDHREQMQKVASVLDREAVSLVERRRTHRLKRYELEKQERASGKGRKESHDARQ